MYYNVGEQLLMCKKEIVIECLMNTWYNPNIKIDNKSVFFKDLFKSGFIYIGSNKSFTKLCESIK